MEREVQHMDEVRVTDPDTGGQKGQKSARFDLIPSPFLWELALVYGRGAQKYADDNWRRGYDWKLSFGAMQRHLHLWWMGESEDSETGLSHLAHAAWHCATLFTFFEYGIGKDTRPDRILHSDPHWTMPFIEPDEYLKQEIRDLVTAVHTKTTWLSENPEDDYASRAV